MDLAKGPDIAGRPDQDRAVEELIFVAFADACDQMQFVFRRDLAPGLDGRPVRNRLRQREGFLARLEHVPGVGQLREHDELRAELDGAADQAEAVRDIVFDLSDHRLHLNAGDPYFGFVVCRQGTHLHCATLPLRAPK